MLKRTMIGAVAVGALAMTCAAARVELAPGVRLEAGGQAIDDNRLGHFVPTVVDWNGDGRKDLIVGSFAGEPGNVRLYLNVGTDAAPRFDKFTCLEAGGVPIRLSGG